MPGNTTNGGIYSQTYFITGEVPGTLYGMSPNGWMDQELWFPVSECPLLLILDGHSSHYTLELIKAAAAENMIIFCLPLHTTADSHKLFWSLENIICLKCAISFCLTTLHG